jgi:uncharacterized iron-regulated protein
MNRIKTILLSFLFLMIPAISGAENNSPLHTLQVRFVLGENRIIGESRISVPPGESLTVSVGGLTVKSVSADGMTVTEDSGAATITVKPGTAQGSLKVVYEAHYPAGAVRDGGDGIVQGNLIGPEGIALINAWYPAIEGLTRFKLTALLPQGFEGISEADEVTTRLLPDGTAELSFAFDHPVDGINLIAGKYVVTKERHKAVDLITYFFPEDRALAGEFLAYTKKYMDIYEDLIGPFPFRRFAVVENILPTGYSMPTFTLLGRDVVKLPFIVETSLGHEVLHQWFGNAVYIDHKSGNWAEGLTTYLSDHLYEDIKGKGWEYRKQTLVSFENYITAENDLALKDFTSRSDRATSSVGYGKTAMVFHMLKEMLGQDVFRGSLKEFYTMNRFSAASWADVQKAFEAVSGKNLDWFFRQWVDGKGALDFQIGNAKVMYEGSKARVTFEVRQRERKDRFFLPLILKTERGEIRKTFEIEKETTPLEIETEDTPLELVIDDNYDLFRRLSDDEKAPVISALLGSKNRIFVLPKGKEQDYRNVSGFLKEQGFTEKKEEDLKHDDIRSASLLIIHDTALAKRLFAKAEMPEGDFSLVMKQNPYSKKSVIGLMSAASLNDITGYLQRITHYGKYGSLAFGGGRNTLKTIQESDRGIGIALSGDVVGIEVPGMTTLSRTIDNVRGKEIVYVGESHDRFEHHRVQLQVIRELYRKNKKIAIGMEMFQRPFQQVLDEYVAGTIDEKTFLKKSEYYKRWGFDYNLYREILLFARANRIPVIALNIKKEIVSKVSKVGIQALSEDDLREVPEQLDLSDGEYRERLTEIFGRHASPEGRNFDFFYQAQVLWDESMAQALNDFMTKNPGYQAIVIAGAGHMAFGSGIPKRAFRLNRKDYAVILNSDDVEQGIADYILYPEPAPLPESPRLMVMLKEEGGRSSLSGFSPDSIAEKAGLRKDDIILSLDGEKIESVEDVKIHLLYKKKGDMITVKVLRKRFLLGDKEMEFKVVL